MPNPRRIGRVTPGYAFDDRTGRYHSRETGRIVPNREIRDALESQIEKSHGAMSRVTADLRNNKVSLTEWRSEMVREIKTIHVAQYTAGQGGWARLNQSDYGRMGHILREQYKYLNGFVSDLQSQMFNEGGIDRRADVRAGLYADASHATFVESYRLQQQEAGQAWGRRVLGSADTHCSDCMDYAERGWMPLSDVPAIGDSICGPQCRCTIETAERLEGDVSNASTSE